MTIEFVIGAGIVFGAFAVTLLLGVDRDGPVADAGGARDGVGSARRGAGGDRVRRRLPPFSQEDPFGRGAGRIVIDGGDCRTAVVGVTTSTDGGSKSRDQRCSARL